MGVLGAGEAVFFVILVRRIKCECWAQVRVYAEVVMEDKSKAYI